MQTKFSSFEAIDLRLEMLRTQRQLSLHRLQGQLQENPAGIVRSAWNYALVPAFRNLIIDGALYGLKKIRTKLRNEFPRNL